MAEIQNKGGTGELYVVGVGASAGGLEALSEFLAQLANSPDLAIVVVQHLDPTHSSSLTELLGRASSMPTTEAADGDVIEGGHVYVIPPNSGIHVATGVLHLTPRDPTRHVPRTIDEFLDSLAVSYGDQAVGVILSGTGSDGALGVQAVKAAGGLTFAQDETAMYTGMPQSAIATGCVDLVLGPAHIADELRRIADQRVRPRGSGGPAKTTDEGDPRARLFALLRERWGVDFSHYKKGTVERRLARRMALVHTDTLEDYLALVENDPREVEKLSQSLLIHATSFFRDPATFEALCDQVFPVLVERAKKDSPLRLWVPACATGEEVYSLVIRLLEFMDEQGVKLPLKVFGTDLSEAAIAKARVGRYTSQALAGVSAARRALFWNEDEAGGFQIREEVRDLCVFARQDVTRDPPFSKIDLVSCRNLLIYLDASFQRRALGVFHYSLREGGFLMLSKSESVSVAPELFAVVESRHGIYARREATRSPLFAPPTRRQDPGRPAGDLTVSRDDLSHGRIQREADRLILARYAPPGVIVDHALKVVQFRGNTGTFLSPPPGRPSRELLKMAREGLLPPLRAALEEARTSDLRVRKEGLQVRMEDRFKEVCLEVSPIGRRAGGERFYLVTFEEPDRVLSPVALQDDTPQPASGSAAEGDRVAWLEQQLRATAAHLNAIIDERESSYEDLQAANEELQAANEEVLSSNEELQTTQEELQATNEELMTLNEELERRHLEASRLGNDLANFLASTTIPIVMLTADLHIRRFTPRAGPLFNLLPSDIGRPVTDINFDINLPDFVRILRETTETFAVAEHEVQDSTGRWYQLNIRPYRTSDGKVDGAVMSLLDIDELKRSEQRFKQARDYAESVLRTVRLPLLVLNHELRVQTANDEWYRAFRTDPAHTEGRPVWELATGNWDAALRTRLETMRRDDIELEACEIGAEFPTLGARILRLSGRAISGLMATQQASPTRKDLEAVLEGCARAADLCSQMLAYAGVGRVAVELSDVNELVKSSTQLLDLALSKKAQLRFALAEDLPLVEVDSAQIRQVLMNLVMNASEAIEGRSGTILVETGRIEIGAEEIARPGFWGTATAGAYVFVEVADDGCGMAAATLAHVFEPFFTTKFTGRGLGLAAVLGIVRKHGGAILVESEVGRGSRFRLLLPASAALREEAPVVAVVEPASVPAGRTVLVVDDEPSLRYLLRRILEPRGYRVLEAPDGNEAVEVFARAAAEIDLVLLDLTMPGRSGEEVLSEIRACGSEVPVILMSGYSEFQPASAAGGIVAFLRKPFRQAELLRQLAVVFAPEE